MSYGVVVDRLREVTVGRHIVPTATFRVRRPAKPGRHRFVVTFHDPISSEPVGGSENLGDAIQLALSLMGPGDKLDVQAVI